MTIRSSFLVNPETLGYVSAGRILGDVNLNLDDKSAIKARGLWEDWHLRQLMDLPARTTHVSGNESLRSCPCDPGAVACGLLAWKSLPYYFVCMELNALNLWLFPAKLIVYHADPDKLTPICHDTKC